MPFVNDYRGLKVIDTEFRFLSEGAFGLVFVDRAQAKVWKVARAGISRAHLKQVFQAEMDAYERIISSEELQRIVPRYYGRVNVPGIVDKHGHDVSAEVHRDLAFQIEFVDRYFQKISTLPIEQYEDLSQRFRIQGINHIGDASVCLEDGKVHKIIDFAVREFELWHE